MGRFLLLADLAPWRRGQHGGVVYDPSSGTWSATSPMAVPRAGHVAILLPNGKVLVTGGANDSGQPGNPQLAELYEDPTSGTWSHDRLNDGTALLDNGDPVT